jgi:hypothetical protein
VKDGSVECRLVVKLAVALVLLTLCAGLGACVTTQVRGEYVIAVGTVR